MENNVIKNYGILTSVSWNSNKWAGPPTEEDLRKSKYDFVKDHAHMHESLNFGSDIFPLEKDGYYIGYTPIFNRPPALKNSDSVKIIFLVSSDYHNSNRKSIIGFYGLPIFGERYFREARDNMFKAYNDGNIKSRAENIIFLDSPLIIDKRNVHERNLLPSGKKISQQGFNYLNSDNVYNLIDFALQSNPDNEKLKVFIEKIPLFSRLKEKIDLGNFIQVVGGITADNAGDIKELEERMKNQSPEMKSRISYFIERGVIATKVKKLTGYRCLVCEALKLHPYSFKKKNADYYIETHHVEQVSTLKSGVLSISNLLTVCANHHRQFHYGNTELLEETDDLFVFKFDKNKISVKKIIIS